MCQIEDVQGSHDDEDESKIYKEGDSRFIEEKETQKERNSSSCRNYKRVQINWTKTLITKFKTLL